MVHAQIRLAKVHEILRELHADRNLVAIVKAMTQEMERLTEDNAQLHAAIEVYREAVRLCIQTRQREARSNSLGRTRSEERLRPSSESRNARGS
jgi:hypothetical protein